MQIESRGILHLTPGKKVKKKSILCQSKRQSNRLYVSVIVLPLKQSCMKTSLTRADVYKTVYYCRTKTNFLPATFLCSTHLTIILAVNEATCPRCYFEACVPVLWTIPNIMCICFWTNTARVLLSFRGSILNYICPDQNGLTLTSAFSCLNHHSYFERSFHEGWD